MVRGFVSVENGTFSVVVAMVGRCLMDVKRGFVVVVDNGKVVKLIFVIGFAVVEEEEGLFEGVVGFFVVVVGLLVVLIVGFLVLVVGFLVVAWVKGLAVVAFLGGNLVAGVTLCVVVITVFEVVDSVVRSVVDRVVVDMVALVGL